MSVQSVLLPVFVYVALVYSILGALVAARQVARRRLQPDPADVAAGRVTWPGAAQRIGASYGNQFEFPVLFFALVALALVTRRTDTLFVILEWLFVLARIVHAGIQVTINVLPLRGAAFAIGAAILGIAWIKFAIDILAAA